MKNRYLFPISFLILFAPHESVRSQSPLSISDLESIQSTSGAAWSSDGSSLYLTSNDALYQLAMTSGRRRRVTGESGFSGTPILSRNRDYLAAAHGNEVWIVMLPRGPVIARAQGDLDTRWDVTSDGQRIVFGGAGCIWSRVSCLGQHARIQKSDGMFGLNRLLIDEKVVASEPGITWIFSPYGSPIEWSFDGMRLYFLSASTGWTKIWSIGRDGSDLRQETFGDCDDRDFQVLGSGSLLFVSNRRHNTEWTLWQQNPGKRPVYLCGEGGTVQSPTVSPDGKHIAYLFSSPTNPPELFLYDYATEQSRQITTNAPKHILSHLARADVFRFFSSNRMIEGVLYKPDRVDSLHPAPAIIKLHGGPSVHDGLAWNGSTQYLASRGYLVLAINYSGSVGYGRAFEESDRYRIGKEDCDDVAAAAISLQALPYVLKTRLGVTGASYGGYLTNLVIGRYPHLFKAAVSWFGITDWTSLDAFPHLHPVVKYFFRDRLGDPQTSAPLHREASPITYSDSIQTPLLLAHGDADTVVPFAQSQELLKALQARQSTVAFSVYHAEGHGWSRKETRSDALRRMLDWFNRYLKD